MEGLETALDLVSPNCWLFKVDLRDAYFSVPMATGSQTLLGFHWKTRFFLFERMPNGLNQAPHEFTKLLKPVVAFLRAQGQRLCIYLDDWFFAVVAPRLRAAQQLSFVKRLLSDLGFTVDEEKSSQEPSHAVSSSWALLSTQVG